MAPNCIHGKPLTECDICKYVNGILSQGTINGNKAHTISVGIKSSNFNKSRNLIRNSTQNSLSASKRISITPSLRKAAKAYVNGASKKTAEKLQDELAIASVFTNVPPRPYKRIPGRDSNDVMAMFSRMRLPNTPDIPVARTKPPRRTFRPIVPANTTVTGNSKVIRPSPLRISDTSRMSTSISSMVRPRSPQSSLNIPPKKKSKAEASNNKNKNKK